MPPVRRSKRRSAPSSGLARGRTTLVFGSARLGKTLPGMFAGLSQHSILRGSVRRVRGSAARGGRYRKDQRGGAFPGSRLLGGRPSGVRTGSARVALEAKERLEEAKRRRDFAGLTADLIAARAQLTRQEPRARRTTKRGEVAGAGRPGRDWDLRLARPHLARGDQILAIPTLVRKLPERVREIIGDLSATEKVPIGLDLRPRA